MCRGRWYDPEGIYPIRYRTPDPIVEGPANDTSADFLQLMHGGIMQVTKSGVIRASAGRFSHVQGLLGDDHEETVDQV